MHRTKIVIGWSALCAIVPAVGWAAQIPVLNASFEDPQLAVAPPFAGSTIADWHRAPVPDWWSQAGYSSDQWRDASGVFVNVDPTYNTPIDNADGNQIGFMFSTPGYELYQDLTSTYVPGQSYRLVVGVQGGGYGMQPGVPLAINLYYRDLADNRVVIDSVLAPNDNTNVGGDQTHLTDYQLDIPVVTALDPWANRPIGIQLISAATIDNTGGYWVMDNVRLSSVPEPALLSILSISSFGLLARRRRGA